MKKKSLLMLLASLFVVSFVAVSCSDDDDKNESNTLTVTGATSNKIDFTATGNSDVPLTVNTSASSYTYTPSKTDWLVLTQSADKKTVTVNVKDNTTGEPISGTLTFSAKGATDVVINITQAADGSGGGGEGLNSLGGSDYYVILLDGESYASIANKVTLDMRLDDDTRNLHIWEGTYSAGNGEGMNVYGKVNSWSSLVVTTAYDWAGGAFNYSDNEESGNTFEGFDLSGITRDHVFHIALKSQQTYNQVFYITDGTNAKAGFTVGTGKLGNDQYDIIGDFKRDGEWYEFEIPMSTFFDQGWSPNPPFPGTTDGNLLAFVTQWIPGAELNMDAIFIYKKAE